MKCIFSNIADFAWAAVAIIKPLCPILLAKPWWIKPLQIAGAAVIGCCPTWSMADQKLLRRRNTSRWRWLSLVCQKLCSMMPGLVPLRIQVDMTGMTHRHERNASITDSSLADQNHNRLLLRWWLCDLLLDVSYNGIRFWKAIHIINMTDSNLSWWWSSCQFQRCSWCHFTTFLHDTIRHRFAMTLRVWLIRCCIYQMILMLLSSQHIDYTQ